MQKIIQKIIHNIIRILASTFSIVLATSYIFDLVSIFQIDIKLKIFIIILILGLYEVLTISILTNVFRSILEKEKKPFLSTLPFLIILYAGSFYMTVNGAEIFANTYLSKQVIIAETNKPENIYLSKIDYLQSKIDSLNGIMPEWKSGRELQETKIKSYENQIIFWQKEFSRNIDLENDKKDKKVIENKRISKKYYYIATVIMLFIFFLNFYYVQMYEPEKQVIASKIATKDKVQLTDEEMYKIIIKEKAKGTMQKDIALLLQVQEYKVSRIIKKFKKQKK